jgi:hypothetical protein
MYNWKGKEKLCKILGKQDKIRSSLCNNSGYGLVKKSAG